MAEHQKVVIAVGDENVQISALNEQRRLVGLQQWPITRFPTLTDVFLEFERTSGLSLRNAACALGIFGTTHGETIMLSRSSWTISRGGLRAMLGQDPIVINDVAARAWAVLGGATSGLTSLSGRPGQAPDFSSSGRWTFTNIERGVGLAVLDVDEAGRARVLECEMGHCIFAPDTEREYALAAKLGGGSGRQVTWEMVLTLGIDDPVWKSIGLDLGRAARLDVLAGMTGRYLGETVMAHGGWSGAVITGRRIGELAAERALPSLNRGFEQKPRFQRLLRGAERWQLAGHNLTLAGLAAALDHRLASVA